MFRALLALSALTLLATGCQDPNGSTEAHLEEPFTPAPATNNSSYTYTATTPPPEPGGIDDYPLGYFSNYDEAQANKTVSDTGYSSGGGTTTVTTGGTPSGGSGQTYAVSKGDTLYSLARKFYRDQARWKDIWNANRARVPDPHRLPIGIKLIIP